MRELEASKEWGRQHLSLQTRGGRGVAAVVTATAELPLPPALAYETMSHPDNAAIFRGIERCTLRKILHSQPLSPPPDQPPPPPQLQRSSLWSPFGGAATADEASPEAGGAPSARTMIEVENESGAPHLHFPACVHVSSLASHSPPTHPHHTPRPRLTD